MEAHSVRDHRKIEIVAEKNVIPKNKRPKRSVVNFSKELHRRNSRCRYSHSILNNYNMFPRTSYCTFGT